MVLPEDVYPIQHLNIHQNKRLLPSQTQGPQWGSAERTLLAFRLLRQNYAPKVNAAAWAKLIGTSPATLSRIENAKNEPTLLTAWKMAAGLGNRIDDLLNLAENGSLARLTYQHRSLFRLPRQVVPFLENPQMARLQFRNWNNPQTLKRDYYGPANFRHRVLMMAQIGRLLAEAEEHANLGRREYRVAPGENGIEQELRDPLSGQLVQKVELGEVFFALAQLKRLSGTRLVEATGVSGPMLSRLEHNQVEPMLTTVDRLAGAFGLSVDEVLWIRYPSPTRWLFHVEERETYRSPQNAEWFTTHSAIDTFVGSDLPRRAELMMHYHNWWDYENSSQPFEGGEGAEPGFGLLEAFKLRRVVSQG